MKKIYVALAEGFEEIEAVTPIDIWRRAGLSVTLLGVDSKQVKGAHGVSIESDLLLHECNDTADLIFLPGGMPGTNNLLKSANLLNLLKNHADDGAYCTAICAAPRVLAAADLLKKRRFTAYPGSDSDLETGASGRSVEVDGKIVTASAVGSAIDFALTVVQLLLSKEAACEIAEKILYNFTPYREDR